MKRAAFPLLILLFVASCNEQPPTKPVETAPEPAFSVSELAGRYFGATVFYTQGISYPYSSSLLFIERDGSVVGGSPFHGTLAVDSDGNITSYGTVSYLYAGQRTTFPATLEARFSRMKTRITGTIHVQSEAIDSIRIDYSQSFGSISYVSEKDIVIAGTGGSVLRSTDEGKSWKRIFSGDFTTFVGASFFDNRNGVFVGYTEPAVLEGKKILTHSKRAYYTTDGGRTMQEVPYRGLAKSAGTTYMGPGIFGVLMRSLDEFIVLDLDGLWQVTNRGATWQTLARLPEIPIRIQFLNTERFVVLGLSGSACHIFTRRNGEWVRESQLFSKGFRSPGSDFYARGMHFYDEKHGALSGSDGRVAITNNGGESWRICRTGTTESLWGVYRLNPRTIIAGGYEGTIMRSDDGGETWVNIPTGTRLTVFEIEFVTPAKGIITGGTTVLLTDDGGLTWREP